MEALGINIAEVGISWASITVHHQTILHGKLLENYSYAFANLVLGANGNLGGLTTVKSAVSRNLVHLSIP